MNRLDNLLAPLLGMAFVALVAVALGSAWVAPSSGAPAALETTAKAPEEVVLTPSRIEVVGVREAASVRNVSYEITVTATRSAI